MYDVSPARMQRVIIKPKLRVRKVIVGTDGKLFPAAPDENRNSISHEKTKKGRPKRSAKIEIDDIAAGERSGAAINEMTN